MGDTAVFDLMYTTSFGNATVFGRVTSCLFYFSLFQKLGDKKQTKKRMVSLSHFLFTIKRECIPMQRLQNSSDSLLDFGNTLPSEFFFFFINVSHHQCFTHRLSAGGFIGIFTKFNLKISFLHYFLLKQLFHEALHSV